MYDAIRDVFAAFLTPMEGKVEVMYRDHLGKVTTGIGNLIDSPDAAWETRNYGASWYRRPGGREASEREVRQEWSRVHADDLLIGNQRRARETAHLELRDDGIASLVANKLGEFEGILKGNSAFTRLDTWPADAQLGLFSMAWAMGPHFAAGWPKFSADCANGQWLAAARNCNMANSWMLRRNAVNRGLFRNAAWAAEDGDTSQVYLAIPGRRPTLKRGMTDADHAGMGYDADDSVTTLQSFLQWLTYRDDEDPSIEFPFFTGEINGNFDSATQEAVLLFQEKERALPNNQRFDVDGTVGPLTWAALGYVV